MLVNLDLEIPKEVQGEDGDLTIALLADLHLSVNSSPKHIQEVVDLTNAQNPDLIVVAGDIFTSSYKALSHPSKYASILRGLKARYGVVAIYGNHDVEEVLFGGFAISPVSEAFRSPQMEDFMRECGFTLLEDESLVLEGTNIQLVGRVDGKKAGDGSRNRLSPQDLLKGLDITAPILVLEHEPDEYQDLAEAGADLVLSGHTHNGQIFPGNLIIRLFHENPYGYRCLYDIHTVVTARVGYYGPPMRVGTNSEVVLIRLRFA